MVGMKMDKKAFAEWLGISFGLANTIFRAGPSHTNTWRAIFAKLPKQSQRSDLWDAYKADLQAILKVVP
jgi:hypothetical protein